MTRQAAVVAPLAVALRDAIMRLNRRLRQSRPVGDLTLTQLSALNSVELAVTLTPRELADTERVRPPTMTKIISRLEERGLIERTPHPTDRRQVMLAATDSGRAVVFEHRRARDVWLAQRLAGLTPSERETLRQAAELLDRLSRS
jgi:DNA-binding MarR family transcriptional regulator